MPSRGLITRSLLASPQLCRSLGLIENSIRVGGDSGALRTAELPGSDDVLLASFASKSVVEDVAAFCGRSESTSFPCFRASPTGLMTRAFLTFHARAYKPRSGPYRLAVMADRWNWPISIRHNKATFSFSFFCRNRGSELLQCLGSFGWMVARRTRYS